MLHWKIKTKRKELPSSFSPVLPAHLHSYAHFYLPSYFSEVSLLLLKSYLPPVLWIPSFFSSKIAPQGFLLKVFPLSSLWSNSYSTEPLLPTCKHAVHIPCPLKKESPCLQPSNSVPFITLLCSTYNKTPQESLTAAFSPFSHPLPSVQNPLQMGLHGPPPRMFFSRSSVNSIEPKPWLLLPLQHSLPPCWLTSSPYLNTQRFHPASSRTPLPWSSSQIAGDFFPGFTTSFTSAHPLCSKYFRLCRPHITTPSFFFSVSFVYFFITL